MSLIVGLYWLADNINSGRKAIGLYRV